MNTEQTVALARIRFWLSLRNDNCLYESDRVIARASVRRWIAHYRKHEPEPLTMRACNHCDGEVNEVSSGDEGWSVCQECGAIEGGDREVCIDTNGNILKEI